MRLRTKIALFIAGVLGCTLLLQRCNKPTTTDGPAVITTPNGGTVIVVKEKDKPPVKIYQPDPGSTVITTDDKGRVTFHVRQFGVGFEPGIGFGLADKPRLALDARFAYFKRYGAHTGLGFSLDKDDYRKGHLLDIVAPYVGGSYVPYLGMPNTSLVASYAPFNKKGFVFVRVRF